MAEDPPQDLRGRVEQLERLVRELRARIAELERRAGAKPEHPVDRQAVREKAVFDWQGPR